MLLSHHHKIAAREFWHRHSFYDLFWLKEFRIEQLNIGKIAAGIVQTVEIVRLIAFHLLNSAHYFFECACIREDNLPVCSGVATFQNGSAFGLCDKRLTCFMIIDAAYQNCAMLEMLFGIVHLI